MVRRRGGLDPRIHIWGALEARLQSVDVDRARRPERGHLAGPDAARPAAVAADARGARAGAAGAAHRPCRARFRAGARPSRGLADPRRAAGRRAAASPRAGCSGSLAYAGEELAEAMRARGDGDARAGAAASTRRRRADPPRRPRPSPPLRRCGRSSSRSTRIETLIRDPYAIYARDILQAAAVRAARRSCRTRRARHAHPRHPGALRRASGRPGRSTPRRATRLLAIGREAFARARRFPGSRSRSGGRASSASRAGSCGAEAARGGCRAAPCRRQRAASR